MENLEKKIRILHSYEIPEILVLPIDRGNEAYLAWLEENLGGKDGWGAH
jgi:periplasmic divalent cation tolerance protein